MSSKEVNVSFLSSFKTYQRRSKQETKQPYTWRGTGSGKPGEKGAGGVRTGRGKEGAGSGIPKVAGRGRKREKLCNIAQYFAIEKIKGGGSQQIQGGNRD